MSVLLGACGTSGRSMRDPDPGAVAPPRRTSTTLKATSSTVQGLNLHSAVLEPSGRLPTEFSCQGAGVSPPLSWTGVPEGTQSMALLVVDLDADGAVQWMVSGIPPSVGSTTKGLAPSGGTELPNSFGTKGWKAPCSDAVHTYEFSLLTFTDPPKVDGLSPQQAVAALEQAAANAATFSNKFGSSGDQSSSSS